MTCRMFFSSTSYDHEVLKKTRANFHSKKRHLAFNALFDVDNVVWPYSACLYLQNVLLTGIIRMIHKFVLTLSGAHWLSQKRKNFAKFAYFLDTRIYECSVFWVNMVVCINLVVNSVLFWLGFMLRRPR